MNKNYINSAIDRKVNEWLKTLPFDTTTVAHIKNNLVVTGGCIVSMLLDEKVNDYDVYFSDMELLKLVAKHYLSMFKLNPPQKFRDTIDRDLFYELEVLEKRIRINITQKNFPVELFSQEFKDWLEAVLCDRPIAGEPEPYKPAYISTNAISLTHGIQIVLRFTGVPEEIHNNFDFIHCTCYWTTKTGVVLPQAALESILIKELKYRGSLYPVCSIFRTRKFISRGWTIDCGQLIKMIMQAGQLPLLELETLEEQLMGVDTDHFEKVVSSLREVKQTTGKDFTLASVCEVVDQVFN